MKTFFILMSLALSSQSFATALSYNCKITNPCEHISSMDLCIGKISATVVNDRAELAITFIDSEGFIPLQTKILKPVEMSSELSGLTFTHDEDTVLSIEKAQFSTKNIPMTLIYEEDFLFEGTCELKPMMQLL